MATYARPTNDADRLDLLEMALATASADQEAGKAYLAEETLAGLPGLLSTFATANQAVTGAQAKVTLAGQAVAEAFDSLRDHLLRIWADARSRVRYGDDGPALLTFVQLPQTGRLRKPTSRGEWLQVAERVQQGLGQVVDAGLAPLADAQVLGEHRSQAQANLQRLTRAKTSLTDARRNRSLLRSQADGLARRIVEDLRYALRDMPTAYQRQVMRSYGVRFQTASVTGVGESSPRGLALNPAAAPSASVVGWQMQPETEPA